MRGVIAAGMMFVSGAAIAAEEERYTIERTPDGYVRLDTRTGEMSICTERSGQLVCRLAADDRTALTGEIERLQDEITRIEKRVAALEARGPVGDGGLPDKETFEKTMGYMEQFFRRFMGIVRDLENEQTSPDAPAPDRT